MSTNYGLGFWSGDRSDELERTSAALWDDANWDNFYWDSRYHTDTDVQCVTGHNLAMVARHDGVTDTGFTYAAQSYTTQHEGWKNE